MAGSILRQGKTSHNRGVFEIGKSLALDAEL